ncbi:MAG: aldehyde dehydrogenase family protein [Candidatus Kryptoniota bacterium]
MRLQSWNPATGQLLGEVEATPPESLPGIVSTARLAQKRWQSTSLKERIRVILRFGEILLSRKSEIANLVSEENGKPVVEVLTTEIIPVLDLIKYYSRTAPRILSDKPVKISIILMKTKKAVIQQSPIGIAGIISPWNYPLLLPLGQIIPALIAGNAVIFKPSEFTPLTAKMISDILAESKLPPAVFNIVFGAAEVGAAVVQSGVDKIFFTGSTAVGRKVSELASKNLTPVSLELGSKDAMIVLDDADLDAATGGALWGSFMNAGQTCISIERCFVQEGIYESFCNSVAQKASLLKVGKGTDPSVDIGPIIHSGQFQIVATQIKEAVKRGAKIISGGSMSEGQSTYLISPTVIVDVPLDSLLMTEETFGPVLPVIKFKTAEEVVEMVNQSKFGLSASIWSKDVKRALSIADKIEVGAVTINDVITYYGISDGVVGGIRESGTGRVHGKYGLLEMTYPKYIEVERASYIKKPWWFRYDENLLDFFNASTDYLFSKRLGKRLQSLFTLAKDFLKIRKI